MKQRLFALFLVLSLLGPLLTQGVRAQDAEELPYAIQLIYAVPKDGIDRNFDNDGTIVNIVQSAQAWLKEQTGGRILNLVGGEDDPTIEFLELSRTEEELLALPDEEISYQIEYEARADGFNQPGIINAIFFEGTEPDGLTCGAAPSPEAAPAHLGGRRVAADGHLQPVIQVAGLHLGRPVGVGLEDGRHQAIQAPTGLGR